MITVNNLTFGYKRNHPIYTDLSLQLEEGTVCGLLGKNGTGKSTLLNLIAGLLTPTKGSVEYNGINTRLRKVKTLSEIFIVPEEFSMPEISIKEYIRINASFYPKFSEEAMQYNLQSLELDSSMKLNNLSMGQRKKAFLAFAFATNTQVLLMDEPTNGLDIPSKSQIRKILSSAMDETKTIVISTHQVNDVDKLLDHILILDDNKVYINDTLIHLSSLISTVADSHKPANAFYTQESPIGYYAIVPNETHNEGNINLELLFNAIMNSPELVTYLTNK